MADASGTPAQQVRERGQEKQEGRERVHQGQQKEGGAGLSLSPSHPGRSLLEGLPIEMSTHSLGFLPYWEVGMLLRTCKQLNATLPLALRTWRLMPRGSPEAAGRFLNRALHLKS